MATKKIHADIDMCGNKILNAKIYDGSRIVRVLKFSSGELILASSAPILDEENIAIARKMRGAYKGGTHGWRISRVHCSTASKAASRHMDHVSVTLELKDAIQSNGMYYYYILLDGVRATPASIAELYVNRDSGLIQFRWGRYGKSIGAYGDNTRRQLSMRFGIAIGGQIAPFKLKMLQKKSTPDGPELLTVDNWVDFIFFCSD